MATFTAGQKVRAGALNTAVDGIAPVSVTLAAGWSNFGAGWAPLRVSAKGSYALLQGFITPSAATTKPAGDNTLCTLAAAYRPTAGNFSYSSTANGTNFVRVDVMTTGVVNVYLLASATTGVWIPIQCEYMLV